VDMSQNVLLACAENGAMDHFCVVSPSLDVVLTIHLIRQKRSTG